jgi:thioredoxin reductase
VGIEMAAEIKLVMPTQRVTLIHSREKLLSSEPLPDDFKERSRIALEETGVEIIMGQRVLETIRSTSEDGVPYSELRLASGATIVAGQVIYAMSKSIPSTGYMPSASLDDQQYVQVTPA